MIVMDERLKMIHNNIGGITTLYLIYLFHIKIEKQAIIARARERYISNCLYAHPQRVTKYLAESPQGRVFLYFFLIQSDTFMLVVTLNVASFDGGQPDTSCFTFKKVLIYWASIPDPSMSGLYVSAQL